MSSAKYHATQGTWSSSQLKALIEDESGELFYKKYISKELEREESGAFDVGTYFHTGILEPHLLKKECAIYPGNRKVGKAWEKFQRIHKGKALLTKSQEEVGEGLIKCVKDSPIAMKTLKKGTAEVSMFVELAVEPDAENGRIFCPSRGWILTPTGWEKFKGKLPKNLVHIVMKVRADKIVLEEGLITDLKSMTENAKKKHDVQQSVSNYCYDLSAALYLDVFSAGLGKMMKEFRWIFASKKFHNSKTWKADQDNILIGRSKWSWAVRKLAEGIATDWQFEDSLGILGPNNYEREWLNKNEKSAYSDLL